MDYNISKLYRHDSKASLTKFKIDLMKLAFNLKRCKQIKQKQILLFDQLMVTCWPCDTVLRVDKPEKYFRILP